MITERRIPPDEQIKHAMAGHPLRTNTEWGRLWGVSRERVRQVRRRLGLPPAAEVQEDRRRAEQQVREERTRKRMLAVKPFPCPVCGGKVVGDREVTCGPGCAREYSGNSKYRYRRDRARQRFVQR